MRTDAELVSAALDGERQAFAVLVKRYERPVRAVSLNVLGDRHLAKDATQDAFVRAYERLAGLRRPEAFGAWLMKIARRCALDSARRKPQEAQLDTEIARKWFKEQFGVTFVEESRPMTVYLVRRPRQQ